MASCPDRFRKKAPSLHCHFFRLSAAPETKEYSKGATQTSRIAFLWCVSVARAFPFAKSQSLIVQSWDPEMTWGSAALHASAPIVLTWPPSIMTCFDVRTCAASSPPVGGARPSEPWKRSPPFFFSFRSRFARFQRGPRPVPRLPGVPRGASTPQARVRRTVRSEALASNRVSKLAGIPRGPTDVPDPDARVAAAGHEEVQGRVDRQAVHAGEVAVVVPDDLVHLQVPAHDLCASQSQK